MFMVEIVNHFLDYIGKINLVKVILYEVNIFTIYFLNAATVESSDIETSTIFELKSTEIIFFFSTLVL